MQPEKLSYWRMKWPLSAGLTSFFLNGPDIKIVSALWAICSLSKRPNSAVPQESNHKLYINKWVWLYPNKTKTGDRLNGARAGLLVRSRENSLKTQ